MKDAKTQKDLAADLLQRFKLRIDDIFGFYFDTKRALPEMAENMSRLQLNLIAQFRGNGFPSTVEELDKIPFTYGRGDPSDPSTFKQHDVLQGVLKARNQKEGRNLEILNDAVISFVYSVWNDEYRPEIAKTLSIDLKYLTSDIFGDVRLLRNSIIHHDGVALPDVKKCKVFTKFKEGDRISFEDASMNELMFALLADIDRLMLEWAEKTTSFGQKRDAGGNAIPDPS